MSNEAWEHGMTLAAVFGGGLKFSSAKVITGGTHIDGETTALSVYPEKYCGMGGGMLSAAMDGAPVFEFGEDEAEEAAGLVAALNFFAEGFRQ